MRRGDARGRAACASGSATTWRRPVRTSTPRSSARRASSSSAPTSAPPSRPGRPRSGREPVAARRRAPDLGARHRRHTGARGPTTRAPSASSTGRAASVARFFTRYDVLLSPTMCQPPYPLGVLDLMTEDERGLHAGRSSPPSASRRSSTPRAIPPMSVPLGWSRAGLPIGVQFAAPFGDEATLFRLGAQLEAAQPWFERRPPRIRETAMNEHDIRGLLDDVRAGRLSRRAFVRTHGRRSASACPWPASSSRARVSPRRRRVRLPRRRSGAAAAQLKALSWDAPSLLNPILALGLKDWNACAIFYEPLVVLRSLRATWCRCSPRRSRASRTAAWRRTELSVTWKLKRGVHGTTASPSPPRTSSSTGSITADPATGSPAVRRLQERQAGRGARSPHRQVSFTQPTPYWPMTGISFSRGTSSSRTRAPSRGKRRTTSSPWGPDPTASSTSSPATCSRARSIPTITWRTGPSSTPSRSRGEATRCLRRAPCSRPASTTTRRRSAASRTTCCSASSRAARARWPSRFGGRITHVQLNQSDPWTEIDGERASVKSVHPFLTDPAVRGALALLVDRAGDPGADARPPRTSHAKLPQRSRAIPLEEHPVGVQHRQGQPAPRRGRVEARRRRSAGARRQAPQDGVPDRHQLAGRRRCRPSSSRRRPRPASRWS